MPSPNICGNPRTEAISRYHIPSPHRISSQTPAAGLPAVTVKRCASQYCLALPAARGKPRTGECPPNEILRGSLGGSAHRPWVCVSGAWPPPWGGFIERERSEREINPPKKPLSWEIHTYHIPHLPQFAPLLHTKGVFRALVLWPYALPPYRFS
jgi:hypothetical protein